MIQPPDIEAVLTHYGADRVPAARGDGWRAMRCPFHDDRHASASINREAFVCHSCGVKGDGLAIIQQQENCAFPDALRIAATIDSDYQPQQSTRSQRKAGRWNPPGRRGRRAWG